MNQKEKDEGKKERNMRKRERKRGEEKGKGNITKKKRAVRKKRTGIPTCCTGSCGMMTTNDDGEGRKGKERSTTNDER